MLQEFFYNVSHNLFKPLLLFFYAGFLVPVLRVKFEFPKVLYQSITIYLLLAIGWHGGEELASLSAGSLKQALGFMVIGFLTNLVIGFMAYGALRTFTRLRRVDAATVAGYYGSDSAGTFVTCLGVLAAANIAYAAYMPVMLAVMEIPGCLVALAIVARLRRGGMDQNGFMPDELEHRGRRAIAIAESRSTQDEEEELETVVTETRYTEAGGVATATLRRVAGRATRSGAHNGHGHGRGMTEREHAEELEAELALEPSPSDRPEDHPTRSTSFLSKELLHEVFFNPGIYLLFAGIVIGFISRLQGEKVTAADDSLFVGLFQGILCLFLLEMGMTASSKLRDLRAAGWQFVAYALIAPNVFATLGISIAHLYSLWLGTPLDLGTYVLFAVLCGAASYIALPAVQRMAIPEASPTLPLAASLGVTFSYNVTIGIPLYMMIAQAITTYFPIYT